MNNAKNLIPIAFLLMSNYPQLTPVFARGQQTVVFEEGVFPKLSTDQITATVAKRLPPLTSEIELRGAEMAKFLGGIVPLELLHSMEIVLQAYEDQLSVWNHDLTERSKTLDGQIAQLDGLSKIWKSTLRLPQLSQALLLSHSVLAAARSTQMDRGRAEFAAGGARL